MLDTRVLVVGVLVLALPAAGLTGCEEEGPFERAGEKVDQGVEEAGEKLEEAGEEIDDAIDDATDDDLDGTPMLRSFALARRRASRESPSGFDSSRQCVGCTPTFVIRRAHQMPVDA